MAATAQSAIAVIGMDIGKNSFHVVGLCAFAAQQGVLQRNPPESGHACDNLDASALCQSTKSLRDSPLRG
jgi:hypothetical protein